MINILLNLSDGLLSDALGIKFICTFNTDLKNIDPAVLRSGRLLAKYEFKKLTLDRVKSLVDSLGRTEIPTDKEMALCDVYNWGKVVGEPKTEKAKIGF